MKPILTGLLLAITLSASAQNYNCLQFGPKNYFISGNNYVRGIRIDSVSSSGADTIYHPYRTQRISNYLTGFINIDTFGASWLGKNVVKHADGTFAFDNIWDTVFIKAQAHIGDSWIFFNDTTPIYYTATLTAEDTMTVLGILDSVKRITISADSAGSPYTIDPVNNFQIVLSKNNGFVQVFDLYTFPYHRPLGIHFQLPSVDFIRWYDYYLDVLLDNLGTGDLPPLDHEPDTTNSVFHLFPFHNPTLMEIYDFAIGDVYAYDYSVLYSSPVMTDEYTIDSITGKTTTPFSVSYTGSTHTRSQTTNESSTPPVITTNHTSGLYALNADTSLLINRETMPEEWNSGYLLHFFPKLFPGYMNCDSPASYEVDIDYRGGGFEITGDGMLPTYSYTTYSIGYSVSYQITAIEDGAMYGAPYQELQYAYYHKNSTDCGELQNFTAVSIIGNNSVVRVSPNPATDHIDITSDQPFAPNTFITVYDMSGRFVFRTHAEQQSVLTINTADWIDGLYIVIVQDNTGIIKKEKVVVRK